MRAQRKKNDDSRKITHTSPLGEPSQTINPVRHCAAGSNAYTLWIWQTNDNNEEEDDEGENEHEDVEEDEEDDDSRLSLLIKFKTLKVTLLGKTPGDRSV